ncbi:hypothetical protein [Pseudomonas aeruginosa]|uniref:hypothetical protein n=1 Tax=Pseudomonas aeruginosa TaxID=287 RepID=UPI0027398B35|nr:hypothetical protein [Pseudomonas aeruginosa]
MALSRTESTLAERFTLIVDHEVTGTRRWITLQRMSGIASISWQKAVNAKQRPTAEMIEAVALQWPQYAFWLITGHTDTKKGHISPTNTPAPEVKSVTVRQKQWQSNAAE